MTPEQVERVAEILMHEAAALRASFTLGDGSWAPDAYANGARRDYREYRALAKAARKMVARYWAAR